MNRFISFLFLAVFTNSAFAQDRMTADDIVEFCMANAPAEKLDACVSQKAAEQNMNHLEVQEELLRQQQAQLAAQASELQAVQARLATLESQPTEPIPSPVPVVSQPVVVQPQVPSWGYAVQPDLVSIYPLAGQNDTLRIYNLNATASRQNCGGEGAQYLLVTNHGVPMQVTTPSDRAHRSGFVEVYFDRNGDGQVDFIDTDGNGQGDYALRTKVVEVAHHDQIYVTWRRGDDIRVHYMVSDRPLDIGGMVLPVVRYPKRGDVQRGVVACDRDATPGGAKARPLSGFRRVYGN